jgi:hypothetical protein
MGNIHSVTEPGQPSCPKSRLRTQAWRRRSQAEISSRGGRVTPLFPTPGTLAKHTPAGRARIDSALAAFKAWCREQGVPWDVENGSPRWSQR